MSYRLFIDDVRNPQDVAKYYSPIQERCLFEQLDWIIVRNYEDFVKTIKDKGIPDMVSFDHDLGEDVAKEDVERGISKRKARAKKKGIKNGFDCAEYLLNEIRRKVHRKTINILIHSMNPIGKQRIINLFSDGFE